jgi:hypothetical protein
LRRVALGKPRSTASFNSNKDVTGLPKTRRPPRTSPMWRGSSMSIIISNNLDQMILRRYFEGPSRGTCAGTTRGRGYKDIARLAEASPVSNTQIPLYRQEIMDSNCSISRNTRQSKLVRAFSPINHILRNRPTNPDIRPSTPLLASGQYRAMHHGLRGKLGIPSNVGSATCRSCSSLHDSNPPLSAICLWLYILNCALCTFG